MFGTIGSDIILKFSKTTDSINFFPKIFAHFKKSL